MPIALITPATALAAALLMQAGGPASAQLQLAAALQPTTPTTSQPQAGREEPRTGAPTATHPQAPIEMLKAPAKPSEGSPEKGSAPGVNAPATKFGAPLKTLDDTSSQPREGIHKTPTSPKGG